MGNFPIMQVYIAGRTFRQSALCDCGWSGTSHWSRGSAMVDAGIHAAQTGHLPVSAPLLHSEDSRILALQAS